MRQWRVVRSFLVAVLLSALEGDIPLANGECGELYDKSPCVQGGSLEHTYFKQTLAAELDRAALEANAFAFPDDAKGWTLLPHFLDNMRKNSIIWELHVEVYMDDRQIADRAVRRRIRGSLTELLGRTAAEMGQVAGTRA